MNENHSGTELSYKRRWIGEQVKSGIGIFPVVVVSGARQVGKSTFLQKEFQDFKYISLDDFSILEQARKDPLSLWKDNDRVIIDEAQKAPEVLNAIKLSVDRTNRKKKFLVSGSSNLLLMKRVSETLAGRAVYFEMLPMTYGEMLGSVEGQNNFFALWKDDFKAEEKNLKTVDPVPFMLRGFMPPLIELEGIRGALLWWEGYIKTYIERDLRDLSQIDSLIDFKRVFEAIGVRTGNLLNQTDIARDTGVSQPTVHRYLKLLEVSNIINRIPPFYSNRMKRITKSPKVFLVDPALSVYLSGYHDEDALRNAREIGSFFETMVFLHLKVLTELMIPKANMFYWRTTAGKEVDFIIEHGKKLLAFEVKLTKNPSFSDIKNLLTFIETFPKVTLGVLIHSGNTVRWLHSKVIAVPWFWLC